MDSNSSKKPQIRHNQYYRQLYPTVMMTLMLMTLFIIAMVALVLYQILHRPIPQFVVRATNNKSMELTAFDEPNYLPETLLRWAKKGAVSAYTFDFVRYNEEILRAAPYFTEAGWLDYRDQVTGLLNVIAQKQLFVNGVVAGTPVISNEGDLSGKGYAWRIQLPFLVTYQSAETTSRQNYMVVMTVVKIPTNVDPMGIGIDQFVMR